MLQVMSLGSIFGPFLVIHAVWMILCKSTFMKTEAAIKTSPVSFHMIGVIQLLIGLVIVNVCCLGSVHGLSLLLGVLGWVLVFRALVSFFFPKLIMKTLGKPVWAMSTALISLLWGIAICWLTFT